MLSTGQKITVTFKAKPSLVIIGGSQNLQFLNDPVSSYPLTRM
jgi:hypothetical protein